MSVYTTMIKLCLSKLRTAVVSDSPATDDVGKMWPHAIRVITRGRGPFRQDPKKNFPDDTLELADFQCRM